MLYLTATPANKTLNFKIRTSDNETIGAWFILSDSYYRSLPTVPSDVAVHVAKALKKRPTILFFHGNAATRAFNARILHYQALSSRLAANVLAIDYRGFADSTGTPSEEGLTRDARAAWDWLVDNGAEQEDILIVGHSLGTGVSMQLGAELSFNKIQCRGIVLLSVCPALFQRDISKPTVDAIAFLKYPSRVEHLPYVWTYTSD